MTIADTLHKQYDDKEKLRKDLGEEIEKKFEKETGILLQQARFIITLIKWILGVLAILLALLGIKAWSDIQNNIEKYFQERLEKKYALDDANSPIKTRLDKLLDRALVNALFTEVIRDQEEINNSRYQPTLEREVKVFNSGELDRLLKIIRSKETDIRVFKDAVFVLNSIVVSRDARHKVSIVLAELLAAKEGHESEWMAEDEKKRIVILEAFYNSEMIDSTATELLNAPVTNNLKYAALNRVASEGYKSAVPAVIKFIDETEDRIYKIKGYRALARLMPSHEYLRSFIFKELLKQNDERSLVLCAAIAGDIAAAGKQDFFWAVSDESTDLKRLIAELAVPLAAKAFESGVVLTYGRYYDGALRAEIPNKKSHSRVTEHINSKIYSDALMSQLLELGANKSFPIFTRYLSAVLPRAVYGEQSKEIVSVKVLFNDDSIIQFDDGSSLTKTKVIGQTVKLEPRVKDNELHRADETQDVVALWKGMDGFIVGKKVKAMKNVSFQVSSSLVHISSSAVAYIN